MTIYGYARISRPQQSIDRQVRNIKAYSPNAIIIQEAYTGTKMDRPKWNRLYSRIHTGDTIIFDSVSRMSRNAEDGFYMYNELFSKGISLVFLKEPTQTPINLLCKAGYRQLEQTLIVYWKVLINISCHWQRNKLDLLLNSQKRK